MITFFGEPLDPSTLRFMAADSKRCDLVVVMGTSLKVGGAVWTMLGKVRTEDECGCSGEVVRGRGEHRMLT